MPTIFWSWQSDTSPRETRDVFRTALVDAINRISADLEEAERPEIDHDTRGTPGSPEIVATIFRKIDEAAIFVADVTPIAVSDGGKHLPNPNVLIELGYAKKSITPDRVVLVWNTALFGSRPEDLPFDMRHRRAPIAIEVPVGADRSTLRSERERLVSQLEEALRASLATVPPRPTPNPLWYQSSPDFPGTWFGNEAGIPVNTGDNVPDVIVDGHRFGYARLIPANWTPRADAIAVLSSPQVGPPLLGRYGASNWGPTRGGFLVFRHSPNTEESGLTSTATRWFRDTGEFWGADGDFISDNGEEALYSEPYAVTQWSNWVRRTVDCCRIVGGSGTFSVALGIDNLAGTRWAQRYNYGATPRALESNIEHAFQIDAESDQRTIYMNVMQATNLVRAAFGLSNLNDSQFTEIFAQALL